MFLIQKSTNIYIVYECREVPLFFSILQSKVKNAENAKTLKRQQKTRKKNAEKPVKSFS